MALFLQSKPHNIDFHEVLFKLAVVHGRTQPQVEDSDSELAGELVQGDLFDKKSAKKRAADRKPKAKCSRLCEVEKSTSVKPVNQRAKSGEDSQRKSKKAKDEAKDDFKHERDEERSSEDRPARRIDRCSGNEEARENQDRGKTMRHELDEADLVEPTSAQGSRSNNVARSKTRKKLSHAVEDEEISRDTAPKWKWKSRSRTIPVTPRTPGPPRHRVSVPVTNGSGIVINENVGNIYNVTT